MADVPITIIGGGVIGCAIAHELSKDNEIILLERSEQIPGENQSSRNSGVVHAGIYYDPGSLKAQLCVEGNELLYEFCQKYGVPHQKTGKLVVATNDREQEYLEDLLQTAQRNQVPSVRIISGEEARALEPNVRAQSALHVPTSGIVEPTSLVRRLYQLAEDNGTAFLTGSEVIDIQSNQDSLELKLNSGETFETDIVINTAGLHSDKIARMVNPDNPYDITPFRGEAVSFYAKESTSVGMNIYPTPWGVFPNGKKLDAPLTEFKRLFKKGEIFRAVGVHLTPTLDKEGDIGQMVTIGPAYTGNIKKDDYSHSVEPQYFFDAVSQFFPNLTLEDINLHQTGIQSRILGNSDFTIEREGNMINLIGIDSPGLTASLAIAKYVSTNLLNQ